MTLHVTSGPALVKKGDLAGLLTALAPRDILFIDEIHRLSPAVEEALYPAMEDFRFDVVLGAGIGAQTMEMKLERFTLVGATTRTGLLASPLRDRFPIQERLDYYAAPSSRRSSAGPPQAGAPGRGGRRRGAGQPRARARRASPSGCCSGPATSRRSRATGGSPREIVESTLRRLEVDAHGLDAMDRRILDASSTRSAVARSVSTRWRPRWVRRPDHRGRLRAVPGSGGVPGPHSARARGAAARLRHLGKTRSGGRQGDLL